MKPIQEHFDKIVEMINDSELIEHFGGVCVQNTKDGVTFGLSKPEEGCESNIYAYNDGYLSTGYVHLARVEDYRVGRKSIEKAIIEVVIFVSSMKSGSHAPTYDTAIRVKRLLQTKYKSSKIVFPQGRDENREICSVQVKALLFNCDSSPIEADPKCY